MVYGCVESYSMISILSNQLQIEIINDPEIGIDMEARENKLEN